MDDPTRPATVIGPIAAVPPMPETMKPQIHVFRLTEAASVPTTALVEPAALPVIGVAPVGYWPGPPLFGEIATTCARSLTPGATFGLVTVTA